MRHPIEPFRREWNDFARRSTVPLFGGTGGTMPQGRVKESRATPWFLAVPQGGTIALKERLKVSFRVPFRSTPFPRASRGTLAATSRGLPADTARVHEWPAVKADHKEPLVVVRLSLAADIAKVAV